MSSIGQTEVRHPHTLPARQAATTSIRQQPLASAQPQERIPPPSDTHLSPTPSQRDISVTTSRTALTDNPPSETHTPPPGIRLSPTPHQRDISVTTRRPHPVNTQFSETFPPPSVPRLPLSSPEQDVPVTTPHAPLADALFNERNPSPTPHAPLTDAAPARHVRHQPTRVSHQSRDIERSLTPSDLFHRIMRTVPPIERRRRRPTHDSPACTATYKRSRCQKCEITTFLTC